MTPSINATTVEQPTQTLEQRLAGVGAVSDTSSADPTQQAQAPAQQTDTVELSAQAVRAGEEAGETSGEQGAEAPPANPESVPEDGSLDISA